MRLTLLGVAFLFLFPISLWSTGVYVSEYFFCPFYLFEDLAGGEKNGVKGLAAE